MRFKSSLIAAAILACAGLVTAGCVAYPAGPHYASPGDYGRASHSETGTVVSARDVMVRSDGSGGAVVGAIAGGAAGAALGGDAGGSLAGGLAGALIGGLLGSEIDKSSSEHQAVEYVIELDSGRTVTVLQDPSEYFEPGARVRVIFGDYLRVVPLHEGGPRRPAPGGGPAPGEWEPDDGGALGEPGDDDYYEGGPYEEGEPGEGEYDDEPGEGEDYPG